MRWLLWLTVGLVVVVAALPFIVLSAMGVMRPTEGFCVETLLGRTSKGLTDAPTAQEQEQSFFVSPELADPTIRVPLGALFGSASDGDDVDWRWPVCMRTRHAEHQILEGHPNWQLTKLGEPNLRHAVRTGSVYRVLTSPSFSRVPIAFRLEVHAASGEGTLNSTWLEENAIKPDQSKMTPEGHRAWWNATLPRRSLQRRLGAQQTRALQALFDDLPPYQPFGIDGIALVIESVHDGRREVRAAFLYPPPDATGRLFCAVANQSGIPKKVLADGDVNMCGD
jgi:hypothetical protein